MSAVLVYCKWTLNQDDDDNDDDDDLHHPREQENQAIANKPARCSRERLRTTRLLCEICSW